MQKVLGLLLAPLKWLAGLLLPIFTRPRIPPAVFWILHILLVAAVFFGLWYVGSYTAFGETVKHHLPNLGGTGIRGWISSNYLLVLGILVYLFAWVSYYIWKIWIEEDINQGEFPDLDEAWEEITAALRHHGIRLDDAPLFLVVGHAGISYERLLKGLPRDSVLTGVTPTTAPLRMFGGRDALYLACPGASLAAKALGFGPADAAGTAAADAPGTKTIGAEFDLTKSIGADAEEVARIMRGVRQQGRHVTEDERSQIRGLSLADDGPEPSALRPQIVQSPETVAVQEARMFYVCQLLAKARWPFCPINGAALVLSLNASENEGDAQKIALAAQKDLNTLRAGLKLEFPTFVLLADLEQWSGAATFLARFPEDKKSKRLGRGFPLAPDVPLTQYAGCVERDVQWIFDHLLPFWSFRLLRLETPNVESSEEAVQNNAEIFRFLAQSQQRAATVGRMVAKVMQPDEESHPLFGGCYVVAQGGGQPWFTQDLFTKVEGAQDFVAWSQEALDEEEDYKTWTWYGYGILLLIWLALGALAYYYFSQKGTE
jgi:hypothetical protein